MPMLFHLGGTGSFFPRLTAAFGWRYVAAVLLTYGANQGVGEIFVDTAIPSTSGQISVRRLFGARGESKSDESEIL